MRAYDGEEIARWVMTLMMCPRCGGMASDPLPTDTCTRCWHSYRERLAWHGAGSNADNSGERDLRSAGR